MIAARTPIGIDDKIERCSDLHENIVEIDTIHVRYFYEVHLLMRIAAA